mmetsp:Transcript_65123/g.155493  ORF Transcript_65123/g.155493 Transcript_65123/m.155493 type:complete len:277 (-) Transcript_65123:264-1094(-)|eukprot:CAMPEP_0181482768 /NCGR_PEP_ID=MMETSP1110-20121109/45043_1 /TAXON_ID=174948 /ORGANISM="Symbiodinium sp., Strain CCMP421" /LENGTH=276 /DNA_ID=CAMNT_0023608393 /DNA_START=56 /DNA_END=886 /DNA_ORIENTATION=-
MGRARKEATVNWWGVCRLVACLTNISMIVGMYSEYLWAADWPELPEQCENRSTLPWLDLADCFHRYTFSHAMLRGQNLAIFAFVGTMVAGCLMMVEHQRVRQLTNLLRHAAGSPEAVQKCLQSLAVYSRLMDVAFPGVLLLVPFNLERPVMHYGCTALVVSSMVAGVVAYAWMPLSAAAGLSSEEPADELQEWAKRHEHLKWKAGAIIALHFVLPAAAAVHHFAWLDATGRLFGLCEVSAILSYQLFLAWFATDDFAAPVRSLKVSQQVADPLIGG